MVELFNPVPQKYAFLDPQHWHWRDAAEDLASLMKSRHRVRLEDDDKLITLTNKLIECSEAWKESKLYSATAFGSVNQQIRDIDNITYAAVRLTNFATNEKKSDVWQTLQWFYYPGSSSEVQGARVQRTPDERLGSHEPEWLAISAPHNEALERWYGATADFLDALRRARAELELTVQMDALVLGLAMDGRLLLPALKSTAVGRRVPGVLTSAATF